MSKKSINQAIEIPPQELTKYNRASGRKTLYLVSGMIVAIVALSLATLFLINGH